jgi:hypothetical protein
MIEVQRLQPTGGFGGFRAGNDSTLPEGLHDQHGFVTYQGKELRTQNSPE